MWRLSTWSTPRGGSQLQDAKRSTLAVECIWRLSTWSTPRGGSQITRCKELHTCCGMYMTAEHLEYTTGFSEGTLISGPICKLQDTGDFHTCCGMYVMAEHLEHTKGWVTNYKMRGVAHLLWNVYDGWALRIHQGVGHNSVKLTAQTEVIPIRFLILLHIRCPSVAEMHQKLNCYHAKTKKKKKRTNG